MTASNQGTIILIAPYIDSQVPNTLSSAPPALAMPERDLCYLGSAGAAANFSQFEHSETRDAKCRNGTAASGRNPGAEAHGSAQQHGRRRGATAGGARDDGAERKSLSQSVRLSSLTPLH